MQEQTISVTQAEQIGSRVAYRMLDELAGSDPTMQDLISRGKRLVDRGIPILILGETGTGKEFLSRALHDYSCRKGDLVAVNCASIPESLAESELFGYAKGAFSGALPTGMKGKIVQADRGTLFLDEIGDMPAILQTRLLRVLSEREVVPLGASQAIPVDLQVICATHQDIKMLVSTNRFREDLYYRIAGGVLRLPTLRERTDIKTLIMQMIANEMQLSQVREDVISYEALRLLMRYRWPGNLRQMHAVIRYACAVMNGQRIEISDLTEELMQNDRHDLQDLEQTQSPLSKVNVIDISSKYQKRFMDERGRVIDALSANRWNISAAARQLGMCRASLYRKLREFEIPHVKDQIAQATA
jgi:transcriptional regulator of acetoin/glycerol metabolism